jgi:phenylalanyl-tRNA synthetase beta chain
MKVPLNWLRDYVDLSSSIAQLADRLTLAGLEVAGVRLFGLPAPEGLRVKPEDAGPVWDPAKVVVGRLLKVERHPDADRLTLPTVEYGAAQPITLVTGAPNIKVGASGQKVVLALAGAVLYDGHATPKALKELKPGKIRGVPSNGMVCSAYELGISDDHEGILFLEGDAPVGKPLVELMGDIVLELEITPNMARCLSMLGVAREVAAITGKTIRAPAPAVQAKGEPIHDQVKVEIEDSKLSARYMALLLKGCTVGPSPQWMQRRLTYAGMRPINNVVDVTNYVMLEWGQPLHAFDYDRLRERSKGKAPIITVRPARPGEKLKTLDAMDRTLTPDNLVIADASGPIALAGVMGGAETEVTANTKNILLESANFDFLSIRRTMKALNLPSEASLRFSKGIHPETVRPAAERAAELMRQHAGATVCEGAVDCYPAPLPIQTVLLEMQEVRRLLGMNMSVKEAATILRSLEYQVEEIGPESLRATVPPFRLDVQSGAADLIEDLIRIHGYDRLPATLLADRLPEQHTNVPLVLEERVRDVLVAAGLQEVITYSLTIPEKEQPLTKVGVDYVQVKNPISSERVVMRHSVLASVLESAQSNLRYTSDVRLFEIGLIYLPRPGEKFPDELRRLAIVLAGQRVPEFWGDAGQAEKQSVDFFDIKGVIETLVGELHLADVRYRPSTAAYLHPGRAASLMLDGDDVGQFGQLHPRAAETYKLGARPILVADLDLDKLLAGVPTRYKVQPVPNFPAALRDIAVIVEENIDAERLEKEIRAAGGDLLRKVTLFDVYRGDSIPAGTKSLAYALSYQADDRTLTDKEVDKLHKKIEDRLKHVLKAQIRGQEREGPRTNN